MLSFIVLIIFRLSCIQIFNPMLVNFLLDFCYHTLMESVLVFYKLEASLATHIKLKKRGKN